MTLYVLKKIDGLYVAKSGSKNSYTTSFTKARKFSTKEEAENNRCIENENIVKIDPLLL
ncbi:hypothetical protein LCGC14_2169100 [marine sediment metagenome]|uniref:Uncharacterized protein n=1 Tax=marine sediment metagenome TaxID=412755 RepID=A0A0F9G391_9ZZZZ